MGCVLFTFWAEEGRKTRFVSGAGIAVWTPGNASKLIPSHCQAESVALDIPLDFLNCLCIVVIMQTEMISFCQEPFRNFWP